MPGEIQLIEGVVERIDRSHWAGDDWTHEVPGLDEALEKWVGRKVSITIEDVTE